MTVSLWFQSCLLPSGWTEHVRLIAVDGLIARVEAGVPATPYDVRAGVGVPGLANVHSHAFQRGMAGLAETQGLPDDDFWSWREVMYRFLARLGPEEVEAVAAQAFAEMLEGGFTRVGEFHYLHHDPAGAPYADPAELAGRIAAAADQTGMGLTLLPVFYAHGNFGGAAPKPGQRRFLNDLDGFARLVEASRAVCVRLPDAVLGVAPHSLRAATPGELAGVAELAPQGPIHIHAAEQMREVEDCIAWSGQRPVEWLLDHAAVDQRWCLIHATHLSEREVAGLASSGAVAGLCPITEANLGDGVFPAEAYLGAGGAIAVGTDSNVLIDAAQELRGLEYSQRLTCRARNRLASPDRTSVGGRLFDAARAGGARAAGAGAGLIVGAPLDVVSLSPEHPSLVGRQGDAWLDGWIFAAGKGAVDAVWRRGRQVVANGRHVRSAEIAARYRRALQTVLGD